MRPKPLAGTLSARLALRIVEFCRGRGHDPEALCSSVHLTVAALAEPEARVHYEVVARLGARALEVTGDENFGLHLAADVGDTRAFDTGVLLLMASPTIRVALERMVTYQRIWGDGRRPAHDAPAGPQRSGAVVAARALRERERRGPREA